MRGLCVRRGWLDEPRDERRVHRRAIPRLGGVAIFLSLVIALLALSGVDNQVTQSLRQDRAQLLLALAPAVCVFLLGIYDDLRGLNATVKFTVQGLAAALFYWLGGRIEALSLPLVGHVVLPEAAGFIVTIVWIVAITNAFNLIDGIDGLATGAALFAAMVMIAVSVVAGHPFVTVLALVLAGALVGFLRYNFNPASIFLGDSGSLFIGFLLAALSILGTQKASTAVAISIPLLAFGVPVIDTTWTFLRRYLGKRPLFKGDREHIHHMLLARGWTQRQVALALYGVCALFGLQALLFVQVDSLGRTTGLWLFIVGVAVVVAVGRLRYHEVDELRDELRRNLSFAERRLRLANNIRVRRTGSALSKATSLKEFFSAVGEMLELSDFAHVTIQLECRGATLKRLLEREPEVASLPGVEVRDGCLSWVWKLEDMGAATALEAHRYWSLRLSLATPRAQWGYINLYREVESQTPLLDANHLCGFLQQQMALAAERLLTVDEAPALRELAPRELNAVAKASGF